MSSGRLDQLISVWASNENNVWATGWNWQYNGSKEVYTGALFRWDGGNWNYWSAFDVPSTTAVWSVWGLSSENLWSLARTESSQSTSLLHWTGSKWETVFDKIEKVPQTIWGTSSSNIWVVGNSGFIARWDGVKLTDYSVNVSAHFYSVWGSSPDDVWAVGGGGTIYHWNGTSWSPSESGTKELLGGIWGSGKSDVWAVGRRGIILRWNGVNGLL